MVRWITEAELEAVMKELEASECGKFVRAAVTKSRSQLVFIKARPECESIKGFPFIDLDEYKRQFNLPCHSAISPSLKRHLVNRKIVCEDFF